MNRNELIRHIDRIKRLINESYPEAQVKLSFIAPILQCLGWDIYDPEEVTLEYNLGGHESVDYALVRNGTPVFFVEAKGTGENLRSHTEQLLKYAWRKAVPMAALTNGKEWQFYLCWEKRDWPDRVFYAPNLRAEDTEDVCDNLILYLSKENVISAEALRAAQEKLGRADATKAILKAWNELIDALDPRLLELLAIVTKEKCQIDTDVKIGVVKNFIIENRHLLLIETPPPPSLPPPDERKAWYYWVDGTGKGLILYFVNQQGSCSKREWNAETGRFLRQHPTNPSGTYQDNFSELIQSGQRLQLSRPLSVKACKIRLPDWALSEFKRQIGNVSG